MPAKTKSTESSLMRFKLLAGQHIEADRTQKPRIIRNRDTGEETERYPSKTYHAGDVIVSETDLTAKFGADKFERLGGSRRDNLLDITRGAGGVKGGDPKDPALLEGEEEMFDKRRRGRVNAPDAADPEQARLRKAAEVLEGEDDPGEAMREALEEERNEIEGADDQLAEQEARGEGSRRRQAALEESDEREPSDGEDDGDTEGQAAELPENFDHMTVAELKQFATDNDIELTSGAGKAAIQREIRKKYRS